MEYMENLYRANARKELTEHLVYHKLALREKKPANRELLEKLSLQEKGHYEFWKSLLPGEDPRPYAFSLRVMPLMRVFFGVTFVSKLLETHEKASVEDYERILPRIPEEHRVTLLAIIEDEKTHEQSLIGSLQERRVAYLGFVALGLADAIVEITGVHAGFLGVTHETLIAGISGVIVGFSAAISMGSAAYLQAKQDPQKTPFASAIVTGVSYLASVILLALPYFLLHAMLPAFAASTTVGIFLLAAFTFFSATVFDRAFWHDITESVLLMLGTAGASYILGTIVGTAFHVGSGSF